jgi:hypothetical protein
MQSANRYTSWMLSFSMVIGSGACVVAIAGCTGDDGTAELPDGSSDVPVEAGVPADSAGFPTCSASQACVEYGPVGPACLPTCAGIGAGGCPSGEVCTRTSSCCVATACEAVSVLVCCPPSGCGST